MTIQTYLRNRQLFIDQYSSAKKSDLGFVKLTDFNIRNFKAFIFILSHDLPCSFTNIVSSISHKKYKVKRNESADKIKITGNRSMIDKFTEQYNHIYKYYLSIRNDPRTRKTI